MINILISGLLLGLGMGASCMAFCAPVLVPHIVADHRGVKSGLFTSVLFSLGRLVPYLVFALVLGTVGEFLSDRIQSWLSPMVMGMGVLLLAYGFSISYGNFLWPNLTSRVCSYCSSHNLTFTLGILMGLTPCIPLTMAMAYSLTLQKISLSVVFFISFWLGSSIYLIGLAGVTGAIGDFAAAWINVRRMRRISGIALAVVGLIFLLGGSNLLRFSTL